MLEPVRARSRSEVERVFRFRYRIFHDELGRTDIDGMDVGNRSIHDEWDPGAEHFYCAEGDEIVGALTIKRLGIHRPAPDVCAFFALEDILRVVDPDGIAITNWLLVEPRHRGSPVTASLLNAAYTWVIEGGIRLVLTFCRPGLVNLYERLGFEQYREAGELLDIGFRVPLMLLTDDEPHLRACRSPFLRILHKQEGRLRGADLRQELQRDFAGLFPAAKSGAEHWTEISTGFGLDEGGVPRLLSGLAPEEAGSFLRHASVIGCGKGRTVVRAGETSDDMFVVVSGSFAVRSPAGTVLAVLGRGDLFGEVAHLARCRRIADVHAIADGAVAALNAERLSAWIRQNPRPGAIVALNLARILSARLAAVSQ